MKLKQLKYIYLLLLSVPFGLKAQVEFKIDSVLQWYYKNYPQEKVYVHTDKDYYIAGQSLWLSIYALSYGTPSDLSKIVYVQLINSEGNIVLQGKFPMDKGISNGDLKLPDSLLTDVYELRCFTAWMLNFDEHFIFHKTVFIQNPVQQVNRNTKKNSGEKNYHIDFFPEGGDLVDGNLCNVAFKATSESGLPLEVSGEIVDEQNNQVTTFESVHDGMGNFSLIPHEQHRYSGNIHFSDGLTTTVRLPVTKAFGLTLKIIEQNAEEIDIAVFHHDEYFNQYQNLVLAAYQSNGRSAVYPLLIEKGKNIFSIKKAQFANGILRLTILTLTGVPLAERVVFLDKNDELKINLLKDSTSFKPWSKNEFAIQILNADSGKGNANFSVSVTDANLVQGDSLNDNINSSFLLSSELSGNVHNPAYYFLNKDDKTKKALDLVMLTNGWRHFKWEEVLNKKSMDLKYPVEKEQDLIGEIAGYNKDFNYKENFKLKILIQNEDSSKFIGYAEPDSNGRFILRDYSAKGKSTVFFEGIDKGKRKEKLKDIKIRFFNNSQDSFHMAPYLPVHEESFLLNIKDADEINFMVQQQKGMLKPVTVHGHVQTKTEHLVAKYVSNSFMEGRASTIDFINNFYSNNNRMFDFLKGRIPGLVITGSEDLPVFEYEGQATLHDRPTDSLGILTAVPYFYVDEVLTSWEDVKNIPFSDIALVQFLPPPVAMAPFNGGFRGVITVYLKKGDDEPPSPGITQNYNHFSFNGFSVTREFYSPDYSIKKSDMSEQDIRSTLYWNPNLVSDSAGSMRFHFFNSDKAKRFLIVIEGMDENGRIGNYSEIIDTNNKSNTY